VDQWRPHLQSGEFKIITDQRSLAHLNDQTLHTQWQHKAMSKMLGLQYMIVYRKGTENTPADALSCKPTHHSELYAVSSVMPTWLAEITADYALDPKTVSLLAHLSVKSEGADEFTLCEGVIRHKGHIFLGCSPALQARITDALHSSATGGHSGFPVTYRTIKQLFSWPLMKQFFHRQVQECLVCQRAKLEQVRYPSLLQPLPVPTHAWETVSMDFVEGFPKSGRYDGMLIMVDKFSRYVHFLPISHSYTAASVAQLFLDHIFKLHSMPLSIISHRDRIFMSAFWKELFRLKGTKICLSSSYHS
jgi:hypothetical protein